MEPVVTVHVGSAPPSVGGTTGPVIVMEAAVPHLRQGDPVYSGSVDGEVREGDIAADLTALQNKYPMVSLGSYPSLRDNRLCTSIVARSTDKALIAQVLAEMADIMRCFGADPATTAP